MTEEAFSEKDLDEFFDFIDGKLFPYFGKGIHTWPNGDEDSKRKFAICLQLEKRGRIVRTIDEPDHVFWMPAS
jgi:hypothetical protein